MAPTPLLGRIDIAELLTVDDCVAAVESAFRAHVAGQTLPPAILGVPAAHGGFHVKAAGDEPTMLCGEEERQLPRQPRRVWAGGHPGRGRAVRCCHAELPDMVAGSRPGRTSDGEITLFHSTGTALQDVAAAVAVYQKAVRLGRGETVDLGH